MLIYPKTEKFQEPLPIFKYEDGLTLTVVPFDLDAGKLVGVGRLSSEVGFEPSASAIYR